MGYPNTRPIRLSVAASQESGNDGNGSHESDKPDAPAKDFADDLARGTPVKTALFTRIAKHCGTCGVIFLIALAWMLGLVPKFDSPFARADEVRNLKQVVSEMYLLQLASSIRAYQDSLCRSRDLFLEDQLETLQRLYLQKTGSRYPNTPCRQP